MASLRGSSAGRRVPARHESGSDARSGGRRIDGPSSRAAPADGWSVASRRARWKLLRRTWAQLSIESWGVAVAAVRSLVRLSSVLRAHDLGRWSTCCVRLGRADAVLASELVGPICDGVLRAPEATRTPLIDLLAYATRIRRRRDDVAQALSAVRRILAAPRVTSDVAAATFEVGLRISRHSFGHGCDFLDHAATTITDLPRRAEIATRVVRHALDVLAKVAPELAVDVMDACCEHLAITPDARTAPAGETSFERLLSRLASLRVADPAAAIAFLRCGLDLARLGEHELVDEWAVFWERVAGSLPAEVTAFAKKAPEAMSALVTGSAGGRAAAPAIREVLRRCAQVSERDPVAGARCFVSSPMILGRLPLALYGEWTDAGLLLSDPAQLRAYFSAESRRSRSTIARSSQDLSFDEVSPVLSRYVAMLVGRDVPIVARAPRYDLVEPYEGEEVPVPPVVVGCAGPEERFRLYKALASLAAGQLELGTRESGTDRMRAVAAELRERFAKRATDPVAEGVDWRRALAAFPHRPLSLRLFAILENARVEHRLRRAYPGLRADLDLARVERRRSHPAQECVLHYEPQLDALFVEALGNGCDANGDADSTRGWVDEVRAVLALVRSPDAGVCDTLRACAKLYDFLRPDPPAEPVRDEASEPSKPDPAAPRAAASSLPPDPMRTTVVETALDGSSRSTSAMPAEGIALEPSAAHAEPSPAPPVEDEDATGSSASERLYDEWDCDISDYRAGWCRVRERPWEGRNVAFAGAVRSEYGGLARRLRSRLELLRPTGLTVRRAQIDGDGIDLDAAIEHVVDRRAGAEPLSERLYTRREHDERNVAACFLVDMSSSTRRRCGAGKEVLDVEKAALLLMSDALASLGDAWAIFGFWSQGRERVSMFRFKDFAEPYDARVQARIGAATGIGNTRLGAAVRHATFRLNGQAAGSRLLIVVSDAIPVDDEYREEGYAREDTRVALAEARATGVKPFAVVLGRRPCPELDEMLEGTPYAIVQDLHALPERLPEIYRRLTR